MSIEAGNFLREARESKGVSIKEASDSLHIRIPYLQALESGRIEIIPSTVQARGFLRIYSEYLGLNAADIISEWDNPGSSQLSAKRSQNINSESSEVPAINHTAVQQPEIVNPVYKNPAAVNSNTASAGNNVSNQNAAYNTAQSSSNLQFQKEDKGINSNISAGETNNKTSDKINDSHKDNKKEKSSSKFSFIKKRSDSGQQKNEKVVSPQDLFIEIGKELYNRRTMLSLTLEDCESQTLIRSIYLSSMEDGNFEQLPSLIQARGMLNNYASFLDLDVDSIMLKFATALQLISQKRNNRNEDNKKKPTKTAGRFKKFFTPDLFIGVFVIVGIVGIIIYSAITITAYRRSVAEPTLDLGIRILDQYIDTTRTPEFLPTMTQTPDIYQDNSVNLTTIDNSQQEENETGEINPLQPVQIFITANQRALMTVISDGKEVFSGRTLPNNTYPFDAENLIEVTVSNADAVSVVYNQQNLGRLGKLGEVLTINFTPYLAATPTPQFSPTPTATYEPTYTPQPETPLPTNTPTPYIP